MKVLVTFLVGGLIIAGFIIAKLWLMVDQPVGDDFVLTDPPSQYDATEMVDTGTTEFVSTTLPIAFSYPSDWQLWEGTTSTSDYIQIADFESKPLDAYADRVPGHKLEITIITQPADLSLEKWMKQTDRDYLGKVGTIEDLKVDGFAAKLDYQVIGYSTFGSVYIPLDDTTDQVLLISLYGPEETYEELRPLFDSILQTIKIQ